MKLKKSTNTTINYPTKESIKPILIGMAITLTACSNSHKDKPIPPIAGGVPVSTAPQNDNNKTTNIKPFSFVSDINKSKEKKTEIIPPRVLGGVPLPPKEK